MEARDNGNYTLEEQHGEPSHSPKGASSAERWMNCPGSSVILKKLALPESDEQDYRRDGIAAHEVGAHCLTNVQDTWEVVGQTFHEVVVDKIIADAVQTYLDTVRPLMTDSATVMIEKRIGGDPANRPHPDFYGTVDFAAYDTNVIEVVDYKHGEGIVVEPERNPQMMYYAYGIIFERTSRGHNVRSDRLVRLTIVQPRAYHELGPVRTWETTVGEIVQWAEDELMAAMKRAEFDVTLDDGEWCRFCPAKLFCPRLQGMAGAASVADAAVLPSFGQARLSQEYLRIQAVKFYIKAVEEEVFRRNSLGNTVPGTKLVLKRSYRVWAENTTVQRNGDDVTIAVPAYLEQALGPDIFTKPELKSPAEIEKLGAKAKKIVHSVAYMPNNGLTVALETDTKPGVKVEKAADIFAHLIEADDTADNSTGDTNG